MGLRKGCVVSRSGRANMSIGIDLPGVACPPSISRCSISVTPGATMLRRRLTGRPAPSACSIFSVTASIPFLTDTLPASSGEIHRESMCRAPPPPPFDLPGFHDAVSEYAMTMTGLGHKLMTAMARGLRLDDSFFVDRYSGNPVTSLRIRDYPVAAHPPAVNPSIFAVIRTLWAPTPGTPEIADCITIVKLGRNGRPTGGFRWPVAGCSGAPGCTVVLRRAGVERLTQGHYVSASASG